MGGRTARRAGYWAAVLVAVLAVIGGGGYAYLGYRASSGPDGTVRAYFAALARSDAPSALGFGDLPAGSRGLLTSAVLAEQQRIAPLHDVRITRVRSSGGRASVSYSYLLGFARGDVQVVGTVRLRDGSSGWRLVQAAVPTTVRLEQAADRIAFAGSAVPDGPTLLFPGALPVRIDTPYLMLDPTTAAVQFGAGATLTLAVRPTPAARAELAAQLGRLVRRCVAGAPPAADCPAPDPRYVPGSLHGRVLGDLTGGLRFEVSERAAGTISVAGSVRVAGSYRRLAYDNVAVPAGGRFALPVTATAYAVAPLAVHFGDAP